MLLSVTVIVILAALALAVVASLLRALASVGPAPPGCGGREYQGWQDEEDMEAPPSVWGGGQ